MFAFLHISRGRQCETRVKSVCLEIQKDVNWPLWRKSALIQRWICIFSPQTDNFLSYWVLLILKDGILLICFKHSWRCTAWVGKGTVLWKMVWKEFAAKLRHTFICPCTNTQCECDSLSFPLWTAVLCSCALVITLKQDLGCPACPSFTPEHFLPMCLCFPEHIICRNVSSFNSLWWVPMTDIIIERKFSFTPCVLPD